MSAANLSNHLAQENRTYQQEVVLQYIIENWSTMYNDSQAKDAHSTLVKMKPYKDATLIPCRISELVQEMISGSQFANNETIPYVEIGQSFTHGQWSMLERAVDGLNRCILLSGIPDAINLDVSLFRAERLVKHDPTMRSTVFKHSTVVDPYMTLNCTGLEYTKRAMEYSAVRMNSTIRDTCDSKQTPSPATIRLFRTDWSKFAHLQTDWVKIPTFLRPDHQTSLLHLQGPTVYADTYLLTLTPGSVIPEGPLIPTTLVVLNCGPCSITVRSRCDQLTKNMAPNVLHNYNSALPHNVSDQVLDAHGVPYLTYAIGVGEMTLIPVKTRFLIKSHGESNVLIWRLSSMTDINFDRIFIASRINVRGFRPLKMCHEIVKLGKISGSALYHAVKRTFVTFLNHDKALIEYAVGRGKVIKKASEMDPEYHSAQGIPLGYFCHICGAEVHNTLVARKEGSTYKLFCFYCAYRCYFECDNSYLVVQHTPADELSNLLDAYILANE